MDNVDIEYDRVFNLLYRYLSVHYELLTHCNGIVWCFNVTNVSRYSNTW